MDQATLYKTQISFTEWFEKINHNLSKEMRKEDNEKRDRLHVLREVIGIPYDEPRKFPAQDVAKRSVEFQQYLMEHGNDLCALRLVPIDPKLPKLRLRGKTVRDILEWFAKQNIDPIKYSANFVPHSNDYEWSTIFIVNEKGIFGEIIRGGHYQLTQGFYDEHTPIFFSYDFENWSMSQENPAAFEHVTMLAQKLFANELQKEKLQEKLNATFSHNYLQGYFETVSSTKYGLWFVDYNRILHKMYADFAFPTNTETNGLLQGVSASKGKVQGKVRVVKQEDLHNSVFDKNDILVCDMTTPAYVPLMQKASAIITDRGGILTHAAIVSRELGIPCVVGTNTATRVLKDGEMVEVDAFKGTINRL